MGDLSSAPGRQERRRRILVRDGSRCVWCGRDVDVGLVGATTEHLVPRVKGGPSWIENELVACARCNRSRGHTTPAEWLEECRRRGWEPDVGAVLRGLERREAAIGERGGQRRARPYLRSQLRRLRRLV
ncbi:hypothetical protein BH24ACT4_BH24ACT4_15650 [soil metagenome]